MLKKSITYTDFTGVEVTEDFYFNLTKAELIELELNHEGGLSDSLKRMIAAEDVPRLIGEFKTIILRAYGARSSDGKKFIKNQELRDEFESTEAYSELFVSVMSDPDSMVEFLSGIMPQDLMAQAQLSMEAEMEEKKPYIPTDEDTKDGEYSWPSPQKESPYVPPAEPRMISLAEAEAMDPAQLQAGLASRSLRVAISRGEWDSMDRNDLLDKVSTGHYFLNEG